MRAEWTGLRATTTPMAPASTMAADTANTPTSGGSGGRPRSRGRRAGPSCAHRPRSGRPRSSSARPGRRGRARCCRRAWRRRRRRRPASRCFFPNPGRKRSAFSRARPMAPRGRAWPAGRSAGRRWRSSVWRSGMLPGGGVVAHAALAGLGGAHAEPELTGPLDLALERGGAGRRRGPHPARRVEVVALAPVLPRHVLRACRRRPPAARPWCRWRRCGW